MKDSIEATNSQPQNQKSKVFEHMLKYGHISTWTAYERYHITRLSALIWLLRHKDGVAIETNRRTVRNADGNNCTFADYILKGAESNG